MNAEKPSNNSELDNQLLSPPVPAPRRRAFSHYSIKLVDTNNNDSSNFNLTSLNRQNKVNFIEASSKQVFKICFFFIQILNLLFLF